MTFKDQFREVGELAREHKILRDHNRSIKTGDSQEQLLLFAEGAVVLVILERFLRILPEVGATDDDTLNSLLEKATSKKRKVLEITPKHFKGLVDIRNTILHGNFEQAAKQAGVKSKEAYFKTQFAPEIEAVYCIINNLFDQVDPNTGGRKATTTKRGRDV